MHNEHTARGRSVRVRPACRHRFLSTKVPPFADTLGIRVCVICDYAEVCLSKDAKWIGIDVYTARRRAS